MASRKEAREELDRARSLVENCCQVSINRAPERCDLTAARGELRYALDALKNVDDYFGSEGVEAPNPAQEKKPAKKKAVSEASDAK